MLQSFKYKFTIKLSWNDKKKLKFKNIFFFANLITFCFLQVSQTLNSIHKSCRSAQVSINHNRTQNPKYISGECVAH